jgi:uncharacterized membrane protein YeaQ/YmgE (transglycosylase-associated protein family)
VNITISDIIVWLVVGALAGSFVGMIVKRKKEGFGAWTNLGVGLVGALLGGTLFRIFRIDLGLEKLNVSLEDLIAALLGSILFLVGVWAFRKWRSP